MKAGEKLPFNFEALVAGDPRELDALVKAMTRMQSVVKHLFLNDVVSQGE